MSLTNKIRTSSHLCRTNKKRKICRRLYSQYRESPRVVVSAKCSTNPIHKKLCNNVKYMFKFALVIVPCKHFVKSMIGKHNFIVLSETKTNKNYVSFFFVSKMSLILKEAKHLAWLDRRTEAGMAKFHPKIVRMADADRKQPRED
jgi:hypothetical protein